MAIDLEIDHSWQDHLPEFLQRRDDGAIVIAGHRVTLFAFLQAAAELEQSSIPGNCVRPVGFVPDRRNGND